jgi:hypothetical protein
MRMRAVLQNWGVEERFSDRFFSLETAFDENWDQLSEKYFGKRIVPDDAYLSTRVWVTREKKKFTKEEIASFGVWADDMKELNTTKVRHEPEKTPDWAGLLKTPTAGKYGFKMSRPAMLNCGDENPWHEEFLRPIMDHLRAQKKCYKAQLAEIDLQRFVDAHIDFYLGNMGDIVHAVAHLVMDETVNFHSTLVEEIIVNG